MYWIALVISVIPSICGKCKFSMITTIEFVVGLMAGMIFGPNPQGVAIGQTHFGWAIWGVIFFVSIVVGIVIERYKRKTTDKLIK